jgi:hypothetical protein
MLLDSPHTSAPMLMRGPLPQCALHPTDHVQQDTHPTDNPPQSARKNRAGEARRRGGRRRGLPPIAGLHRLSRRRASTGGRPRLAVTARGRPPGDTRRQSRVGPQQCQATNRSANSELRPGTGKGAIAGAGPPRRATGPLAGSARESPPQPSAPPTQPPTPRPPPTTEDRCPVVSNRALHCVMQQRCHHASTSPGSPS